MFLRVRDFCQSTNNINRRDIIFNDGDGGAGSNVFPVRILPPWYTNNIPVSPTNTNINKNTTMFRLYILISSASSSSLVHTLNSNQTASTHHLIHQLDQQTQLRVGDYAYVLMMMLIIIIINSLTLITEEGEDFWLFNYRR